MKKDRNFLEILNSFFPTGYQVINIEELALKVSNIINKNINLFKDELGREVTNLKPAEEVIQRGTSISVSNSRESDFLVSQGWFAKDSIEIVKQAEIDATVLKEATEDVLAEILKKQKNQKLIAEIKSTGYVQNVREMNPDHIRLAQDACYSRMKTDPIFSGAVKHLLNYTVGNGVSLDSQVSDINAVLSNYNRINKFDVEESLESLLAFRHFLEGESFLYCEVDRGTGDTYSLFLEPYEIVEWEYHPKWRNKILAYRVETGNEIFWVADADYFENIFTEKDTNSLIYAKSVHHDELYRNIYIHHLKENKFPNEFRGRPLATACLRYLKFAEDFIYDRMLLNHERSRVVWIRTILGRAATNLANYLAAPPGGVMLNQTEDIKYEAVNPQIGADDVKEDYLSIMYAIAACFLMPIHVLNMRAGEQVYASVLSAKAPFTKAIQNWQEYFKKSLLKIHRKVIYEKTRINMLKKSYKITVVEKNKEIEKDVETYLIPVYYTFPNPVDEQLNDRTSYERFLFENRVVSGQTIRESGGYDNFEELRRLNNEEDSWEKTMKIKTKQTDSPDGSTAQTRSDSQTGGDKKRVSKSS
jgi:hypothetical protein